MSLSIENITAAAQSIASEKGLVLVDLIIRGSSQNPVIEVFVDGAKSVSAEDCASISRTLDKKIIDDEMTKANYRLDVSSPGVDKPLKYLIQFPKHINRKFSVKYKKGDEINNFSGRLKEVNGEDLVFEDKNEVLIPFNQLIEAKVLISFS
jgi:ribosome maturation factor RimP